MRIRGRPSCIKVHGKIHYSGKPDIPPAGFNEWIVEQGELLVGKALRRAKPG